MTLPQHLLLTTATRLGAVFAAAALLAGPAAAATLRVATWNLGWHVSQAETGPWIAQCSKHFAKNSATGIWELASPQSAGASIGWQVDDRRPTLQGVDLAVMPPCGVYRDPSRVGIAVTPGAWAKRNEQIARVLQDQVQADVIAFQEVSGVAAVREALGPAAAGYEVCSFDGRYKIQRLAFAWRKSLGPALGGCQVFHELSLPHLPARDQVRPGLALTLQVAGQKIRFLTLHLKSSCVSPLNRGQLDGDTGPTDPCPVLQQQVAPLEAIVESLPVGVDHVVVLGDFNRNLAHEAAGVPGAEPVRSDGSTDLRRPLPAGVRTRNLLLEVNDAQPPASRLMLLAPTCSGPAAVSAACDAARTRLLDAEERRTLAAPTGLGCRNASGLVFLLASERLAPRVVSARKVPLGPLGGARLPDPPEKPEPLLAVSDHCPQVVQFSL
jgi:endonuclease/exonuclease/phosphatase family metal-dependent hydrolase